MICERQAYSKTKCVCVLGENVYIYTEVVNVIVYISLEYLYWNPMLSELAALAYVVLPSIVITYIIFAEHNNFCLHALYNPTLPHP